MDAAQERCIYGVESSDTKDTSKCKNSTDRLLHANLTTVLNTVLKFILYLEQRGGKLKHQVYSRTWYGFCSDTRTVVVYLQTAERTINRTHFYSTLLSVFFNTLLFNL